MADKKYIVVYALYCTIAVMLIAAAFLTDSVERLQVQTHDFRDNQLFPESVRQLDADTEEYTFHLNELEDGAYSMIFYTRHRFIDVFMDGRLNYSLQISNARFGNTAGCLWNFVEIPNGTRQAVVRIKTAYESMRNEKIMFFYGKAKASYEQLLNRMLPALILGIINIILGLFLMAAWFFARRHTKNGASLLHIGTFSCILGIWSVMESDLSALLFKNQQAASFFRYIIVLFMGMPFLLFLKDFLQLQSKKGWKILLTLIFIWIPINIGMQLMQVRDMKQTVTVSHMILVAVLAYMGYAVWCKKKEAGGRGNRFLNSFLYGAVILFTAVMVSLVGYYTGEIMLELFGQMGFLVYVLLIGLTAAREALTIIEAGRQAELYRTLATKDVLTGMYNRNAYIEEIGKITDPSDMMIVTFDLNNLKQCNDKQGHMFGDKYIIAAASILENVFGQFGNCYRIGGDEFCVIFQDAHTRNIDAMVTEMKKQQNLYNQKSLDIFMQIACGYAVYDAASDRDIEATRSRADEMMYEDKRLLKAATGGVVR